MESNISWMPLHGSSEGAHNLCNNRVFFLIVFFFLVYDHTGPICDISTNASSILYSHNVMFSAGAVSVCHMVLLLLHVEHFINFYFIPIDLLARLSLNVSLLQSPITSCCLSVGKLKRTY
jgi:hypothetical protein